LTDDVFALLFPIKRRLLARAAVIFCFEQLIPAGSPIFKEVREKRCKAFYTLAKRSPTALECALAEG
jgi:hypothetical protein